MPVAFSSARSSDSTASATGRATAVVERIECAISRRLSSRAPSRAWTSLKRPRTRCLKSSGTTAEICVDAVSQLVGQRDDLLQRPVVQVEAETHEAPLAGSHEVVLALHSAGRRGMRARGAARARSRPPRGSPRDAPTRRRVRGRRARRTAGPSARRPGRAPGPSRRCTPSSAARATSRSRRLRGALPCETRQVVEPAASRIQREPAAAGASSTSKRERELGGDRRRKLGELLARQRSPEDCEGRSLGRQPELVGRGRDRGARLARLEPVLDGDRDDRVAEEVERGALAPAVGQAPRSNLAGTERGTQVAWKERLHPRTVALRRRSPPHGRSARRQESHRPARPPGPPQRPQFPQLHSAFNERVEQWDPGPNRRSSS